MIKRLFDLTASVIGILLLAPVYLVIALLIRLTSAGPIFYYARRVGQGGKHFTLYKFRTMVVNADQQGPGITRARDPRITKVGRFLRHTKLDELPQLFNIIRGDMSFVGPRPEDPRYVALYTPEQQKVLAVKPGITSLASVQYRHEEELLSGDNWEDQYIHDVLIKKLQIDLEYIGRASLLTDLKIILRTLAVVSFTRKGHV